MEGVFLNYTDNFLSPAESWLFQWVEVGYQEGNMSVGGFHIQIRQYFHPYLFRQLYSYELRIIFHFFRV